MAEKFRVTSNSAEFIAAELATKTEATDDPVLFCNVSKIFARHDFWMQNFPNIKPYYAVKCNTDPILLKCLAKLGTGFDCASKSEIGSILDMGVSPERIVFANPCKPQSHIRYAARKKVSLMTFDNETELHKTASLYPSAKLIVRIRADAENALVKLGAKFGCSVVEAVHLLKVAHDLGLTVVGVSFHVGSGCQSPGAYQTALEMCSQVFEYGKSQGFVFTHLDIGGGFPGYDSENELFCKIAKTVNKAINKLFSDHPNLSVFAEPGRFFAASCFTLAAQVISKRVALHEDTRYYINDGVYGTFSGIMYENAQVHPHPLALRSTDLYPCSVWGPTCDSIDKIGSFVLPDMNVGDWMLFYNMGAYSIASCSGFNGFGKPVILYYLENPKSCMSVPSQSIAELSLNSITCC